MISMLSPSNSAAEGHSLKYGTKPPKYIREQTPPRSEQKKRGKERRER
jgi:hypothetical protein